MLEMTMIKNPRKLLVLTHLIFAGLMAPAFMLVAISGGLYLIGNKGAVKTQPLILPAVASLDFKSPTLESDVRALLKSSNIDHTFEYVKNRGNLIQLRPTSRPYLEFKNTGGGLTATRNVPNFQKSMMELHKGHGPSIFKAYQKLVAIALIGVVLGGLFVGLLSLAYRRKTIIAFGAGTVLFIILAFFA